MPRDSSSGFSFYEAWEYKILTDVHKQLISFEFHVSMLYYYRNAVSVVFTDKKTLSTTVDRWCIPVLWHKHMTDGNHLAVDMLSRH